MKRSHKYKPVKRAAMANKIINKDVTNYVSNVSVVTNAYFSVDDISVEHRSNNSKRDFLFVNKIQGKHIPCSPTQTILMCKSLADEINAGLQRRFGADYVTKKVLVIAFAETATAIGNIVADNLKIRPYIIQTTREEIEDSKVVLEFKEEHSHAVEQSIKTYDNYKSLEIGCYDYIIFVDDEITTGKTILNCMREIQKMGYVRMEYGIASICNWMSDDIKAEFANKHIDLYYLIKGSINDVNVKMLSNDKSDCINEKKYIHHYNKDINNDDSSNICSLNVINFGNVFRTQRLGHYNEYAMHKLYSLIDNMISQNDNKVRIIGTEEFMHMPILMAKYIEDYKDCTVYCQATTRSCIDVIRDCDGHELKKRYENEIMERWELPSAYDNNRLTYLYNISIPVDKVIFISDTKFSKELLIRISEIFSSNDMARAVDIIYIN